MSDPLALMRMAFSGSAPPVAFVAAAKGANTAGGDPVTVTIPAVQTNDVLVLAVCDRGGSSGAKPTIADNDSGTWTTRSEDAFKTTGGWCVLATRAATAATSAKTITVTLTGAASAASAVLMVYRNVKIATPYNSLSISKLDAGVLSVGTVTPTYAGGMLGMALFHFTSSTGADSSQSSANFGAFTEPSNADAASSAGTGCGNSQAYLATSALTATGTLSWTSTHGGETNVFMYEMQKA